MDLLTGIFVVMGAAIAGLLGNIVGNMVACEFYDRTPSIAIWLIARAVAKLPDVDRARYQEELRAHLDEYPGKLGKLLHAVGVYLKASTLASELANRAHQSTRQQSESGRPAGQSDNVAAIFKVPHHRPADYVPLSPREREVMQWVAVGKTDSEIADILSIGTTTVTSHVENAKQKLDAFRRTYAVVQAIRFGEIDL